MPCRQWVAIVFTFGIVASPAKGDDIAEAAREVLARNGSAVLTLKLVISEKMSFEGFDDESSESVYEIDGTVIDDSGLIVTSLLATNPSHYLEDMFMQEDEYDMDISSTLEQVSILMDNGREIEAQIVLRDQDLDLAFIRPDEPLPDTVRHVDLSLQPKVQQFDRIIVPYRLGRVANRLLTASLARVDAIMEKPRPFYIVGYAAEGAPAFTDAGECLGIVVNRKLAGGGASMSSLMYSEDFDMTMVVVPGPDILEIAQQAPAKAPEENGEETEAESEADDEPEDASDSELPSSPDADKSDRF